MRLLQFLLLLSTLVVLAVAPDPCPKGGNCKYTGKTGDIRVMCERCLEAKVLIIYTICDECRGHGPYDQNKICADCAKLHARGLETAPRCPKAMRPGGTLRRAFCELMNASDGTALPSLEPLERLETYNALAHVAHTLDRIEDVDSLQATA